jgi:hypothetical protein
MTLEENFVVGLHAEDVYNRNATLSCERPYGSPIFISVRDGDINKVWNLRVSKKASVHDVDPYGLGLLYVRYIQVFHVLYHHC